MNHLSAAEQFFNTADAFVAWVKSSPQDAAEEAKTALVHLSEIYTKALFLMKVEVERAEGANDPEECRVGVEEWNEVYERLNHFPFTYYQESELPLDSDTKQVFTDIVEGLTDIYQDITEGLNLYKAGEEEQAACHWQMTFEYHWGRHCLGAMKALHSWFQEESDFQAFQK